jgi:hypothetical protein
MSYQYLEYFSILNKVRMKNKMTVLFLLAICIQCANDEKNSIRFAVSFTKEMAEQAQQGRLLLMLTNSDRSEPRMQINDGLSTQLVLGIDVDGMQPDQEITIDRNAFGFPLRSLSGVPKGDYYLRGLIHRYETFKLKTGHLVKLLPDQGEGQHWNTKTGHIYSKLQKISIEPSKDKTFKIVMNQRSKR